MKTMRSGAGITITVVSILLWCAFADAAALTDLQMLGRYRELEKAAEQKLEASKQEPGASLLGYLCVAYSKLKRYNKLFDCLDKLENASNRATISWKRTSCSWQTAAAWWV